MARLLGDARIRGDVADHLARRGSVFAASTHAFSGCRSWGVAIDGRRWFVKASIEPRAVRSLWQAIALHGCVSHRCIVPLVEHAETDDGLALVYPWIDGEVLESGGGRERRLDPTGPHARFRALPVAEIVAALDDVFAAHVVVAAAGFVAVDLYDGAFIYDFEGRRMYLCDLDEYRPGPFVVEEERLKGSKRFMAAEELTRGATIDERTTVFDLGRTAAVLLDEGDADGRFRGTNAMAEVIAKATQPDPTDRHATVEAFVSAWTAAASAVG